MVGAPGPHPQDDLAIAGAAERDHAPRRQRRGCRGSCREDRTYGMPCRQCRTIRTEAALLRVVGLVDPAVAVHAVHEDVAAVGEPGEREVLALEVGRVVVAVADGDPLADAEQLGLLEPAAARERRAGRAAAKRTADDRVPVAEAEAGLAVARRARPCSPAGAARSARSAAGASGGGRGRRRTAAGRRRATCGARSAARAPPPGRRPSCRCRRPARWPSMISGPSPTLRTAERNPSRYSGARREPTDQLESARHLLVEVREPGAAGAARVRRRGDERCRGALMSIAARSAGSRRRSTAATYVLARAVGPAGAQGARGFPGSGARPVVARCARRDRRAARSFAARSRRWADRFSASDSEGNEAMLKRLIVGSVVAAGLVAAAPAGAAGPPTAQHVRRRRAAAAAVAGADPADARRQRARAPDRGRQRRRRRARARRPPRSSGASSRRRGAARSYYITHRAARPPADDASVHSARAGVRVRDLVAEGAREDQPGRRRPCDRRSRDDRDGRVRRVPQRLEHGRSS